MAATVGGRWPLMLRTGWVKKAARVALWDVSHAGRWDSFIGAEITDAILHYRPMPNDGYWCLRITLSFDGQLVHLMLGEADGDHRLAYSADNVAVMFPSEQLPDWAQHDGDHGDRGRTVRQQAEPHAVRFEGLGAATTD
jgi:hypothetical protein